MTLPRGSSSGKGSRFLGSAIGRPPAEAKQRKPIPHRSKKQAAAKRATVKAIQAGTGSLTPPQDECQHPRCQSPGAPLTPHHVVYQQHLRPYGGDAGDPSNTISLCDPCHMGKQHNRADPLPVSSLTPDNLRFIVMLMGPGAAEVYLSRYYQSAEAQ